MRDRSSIHAPALVAKLGSGPCLLLELFRGSGPRWGPVRGFGLWGALGAPCWGRGLVRGLGMRAVVLGCVHSRSLLGRLLLLSITSFCAFLFFG